MAKFCSNCGVQLIEGARFCAKCGAKIEEIKPFSASDPSLIQKHQKIQTSPTSNIWYQDYYKIRKKVVTIGQKYWIEDQNQQLLGFCKQKILKLKEDIRVYTDESLTQELFCIKQQQILDAIGNFAVMDSATNTLLGSIKREWLSSVFTKDTWEIYSATNQLIGKIEETSMGRALARKYVSVGALIPEKMTLTLNDMPVAEINQSFKIIGDIWEMKCIQVPPDFDRRVLLSAMLLMGLIERRHK